MPRRGSQRPPLQAFDNATYVISREQLASGQRHYSQPAHERSHGFNLARSFDERDLPLGYCHPDAGLYAVKPAWLAGQRGIKPAWLAGQRSVEPHPIQAPHQRLSHHARVRPQNAVLPDATAGTSANRGGSSELSTSSTTTSTATTSSSGSGNINSTGHREPCYACTPTRSGRLDTARRSKHRTSHARHRIRSSPHKRHERRVSWAPCAPIIMMALMMALLLLVSLATVARSKIAMDAVSSAGHPNVKSQKPHAVKFFAPRAITRAAALPVSSSLASSTSWRITKSLNVTKSPQDIETRTERPTDEMRKVTARNMRASSHGIITKRTVPEPAADANDNVEAEESGKVPMAFPFRRPTRPMCGDVYYTVCRPSTEREFHYRRSANACVETAADVVHSCNRGVNRFASLAHCRRSCTHAGRRPAKECFGKPLLTSCARQDVLFSWWFFEGRECVPWSFPSGGCPANDSAVFHTAHECTSRCLRGNQRDSQCLPPRAVACDSRHLKYPFFADLTMGDGRVRCLRSSPDVLQHRRCLIGANRFRTRESCMATCTHRPLG
ncbi:hypothetical protein MTO96_028571 [Rhipicephalus appendiculatus]